MIQPPVHPKIKSGESLPGYLVRLAELNMYPNSEWITGKLVRKDRAFGANQIEELLLEHPWTGYVSAKEASLLKGIPNKFLEFDHTKVCPECVKQNKRWEESWHIRLLTGCPIHRVWLIDCCSSCGEQYSHASSRISACKCGGLYENENLVAISPSVANLVSFIVGQEFKDDLNIHNRAQSLSVRSKLELIEYLIYLSDLKYSFSTGWSGMLRRMDTAKSFTESLAANFFSGEDSFARALSKIDIDAKMNVYRKKKVIEFIAECEGLFPAQENSIIYNCLQNLSFRVSPVKAVASTNALQKRTIAEDGWIPLESVVKDYSIELGVLKFLMKKGVLQYIDFRDREKQRTVRYLLKSEIEKHIPCIGDIVGIYGAGEILGIEYYNISGFARAGLYKSIDIILGHKANLKYFSKIELLELQKNVLNGLAVQEGFGRPFGVLITAYSRDDFLVAAIRAIADGEIASVSPSTKYKNIGEIEVHLESFSEFYEVWREEDSRKRRKELSIRNMKNSVLTVDLSGVGT